jgi:hypothetical protein
LAGLVTAVIPIGQFVLKPKIVWVMTKSAQLRR